MAESIKIDKSLFVERLEKLLASNNRLSEQLRLYLDYTERLYAKHIMSLDKPIDEPTVEAVARFFGIYPGYLTGLTDQPNPKKYPSAPIYLKLYERLWNIRDARYCKEKDIAEYLGITEEAYRAYEEDCGQIPSLEILIKLADFYDVSLDYLALRSDNPQRQ